MNLSVNDLITVILFIGSMPIWFNILTALEVEKFFKKGKLLEINMFYILVTVILSYLTQQSLMFLINVWK